MMKQTLNLKTWHIFLGGLTIITLLFISTSNVTMTQAQSPTFEPPALKREAHKTPLWYQAEMLPTQFDWRDYGSVGEVREGPRANPTDPNFEATSFVSAPKNQGACGSCYSFGATGSVEAFLWQQDNGLVSLDLSENNAKNCNARKQADPQVCGASGTFSAVADLFNKKGTVLESDDPYVAESSPSSCKVDATPQQTILGWLRIGASGQLNEVDNLKNYLVNYGPLEISVKADNKGDSGQRFKQYDQVHPIYMPLPLTDKTDHSVLLVGWNDEAVHEGGKGVWIIKNSWGTGWGKQGFAEVAYGSANLGLGYAFVPTDYQPYDKTGNLLWYDTFGTGKSFYTSGLGSNHGMVRFTPTQDSCADRVELQLFDATDNINVAIYDDLVNSAPTQLLATLKDASLPAGGNISLKLDGKVQLKANDDIYVVVNLSADTLSADASTKNTGRSYLSYDEGQSWEPESYTLNVRVRTTACGGASEPTPTATAFVPTPEATATPLPSGPTATPIPDVPVDAVCLNVAPREQIQVKSNLNNQLPPLKAATWPFKRFLPRLDDLHAYPQRPAPAKTQHAITPRQSDPYFTGKDDIVEAPNVYGRVLLPNSQVIEYAKVSVYRLDAAGYPYSDGQIIFTAKDGTFGFYLVDGQYIINVDPPYQDALGQPILGVNQLAAQPFTVTTKADLGDIKLPVATKHIQGTLKDVAGNPVSEAILWAYNPETTQYLFTHFNNDGTFELVVSSGSWELQVVPDRGTQWVPISSPKVTFLADNSPETIGNIALLVQKAEVYLTGKLVAPDGSALPYFGDTDIGLDVRNKEVDSIFTSGYIDAQGNFSIPLLVGTYGIDVWLEKIYPQYSPPSFAPIEITKDTNLGTIPLLANNSPISGKITNVDRQPLEGIYVDIWQEGGVYVDTGGLWVKARTNKDGIYEAMIPAGVWKVTPYVPDYKAYLPYAELDQEITATPNLTATADFTLEPSAGYIYGKVIDQVKNQVGDIIAYAYIKRDEKSDPIVSVPVKSGKFTIKMPFGHLKMGLYVQGNSPYAFPTANEQPITADGSFNRQDLVMEVQQNQAHIQGQVVDKNGVVVPNSSGQVMAQLIGDNSVWQAVALNQDGTFDVPVTVGTWQLSYEVQAAGYAAYPIEPITVIVSTAAQTVKQKLTLMKLEQIITGTVVNEAGQRQSNVSVWVQSDNYKNRTTTDTQGEFSLTIPTALIGTMQVGTAVKACSQGASFLTCQVDAIPQTIREFKPLNLVLRGTETYLVGQVRNIKQNNSPVSGANISGFNKVGGQSAKTISDANGCFAFMVDKTPTYDWQISADYAFDQNGQIYHLSNFTTVSGNQYGARLKRGEVEAMTGVTLAESVVLQAVGTLPQTLSSPVFRVDQGWTFTLADGTTLEIPANAVNTREQEINITIQHTTAVPNTYLYRPVSHGYNIAIYEAISGKEITKYLSKPMMLSFAYGNYQLTEQTAQQLQVGALVNDSWQLQNNFVVDTTTQRVKVQVNRAGTYALLLPNVTQGAKTYLPLIVK